MSSPREKDMKKVTRVCSRRTRQNARAGRRLNKLGISVLYYVDIFSANCGDNCSFRVPSVLPLTFSSLFLLLPTPVLPPVPASVLSSPSITTRPFKR